ncbi:MAG TPA: glutaminyl-peptide cyclotransferase [Thermoanaerobaculia bacterium]
MVRPVTVPAPQRNKERLAALRWALIVSALLVLALLEGWSHFHPAPKPARLTPSEMATATNAPNAPERLAVKVLSVRPHDPAAFTQGLLLENGSLYESTGQYGQSSLREVDPRTGAVKRQVSVPPQYFAEGLTLVGERLIQLTWQERKALVYNRADFKPAGEFRYEGDGWGLCWDGVRLVMSDGSDHLTFRDPKTFAVLGTVKVTVAGQPAYQLNELECVDGPGGKVIYANVWQTDDILRIDPKDGRVTAVIDAAGLLTREERLKTDVLNGIAWDPATQTFLITGKLWPKMFQVKFVPAPR